MSLSTAGTGKEGMRVMPCESRASDETQHSRADSDVECGAGGCGGGARPPIQRLKSIYDVRESRSRWYLLALAASVNMLLPFANTLYMPALAAIKSDLHTTTTLTAASIAVYMFAIGTGSLLWGPVSDRWGRRWCLYVSTVVFLGFTVGCVFSRNIVQLIVLRAFQGLSVAAFGVSAQALVADVFPPDQRGRAMGVAAIPILVGPVVGPLLGGGLSQAFGWRSTFVCMAIMGCLVLGAVFLFMEETHHFHVLARVRSEKGEVAWASITESATTPSPRLAPPYRPLLHLLDPLLLPQIFAQLTLYGTLYACMIVLPYALAAPPYSLSQALIGVCNCALGAGLFVSAPIGGLLADRAHRRWPHSPSGRMLVAGPAALALFPPSAALFGWSMHYHLPLGLPLAACFLAGLSIGFFTPAVSALVSIRKQNTAAAASGAQSALMFVTGGVFVIITPKGMATMGLGPFITMLAAFTTAALAAALACTIVNVRRGATAAAAVAAATGAAGGAATDAAGGKCADAPRGWARLFSWRAGGSEAKGEEARRLLAVEEAVAGQSAALGAQSAALAALEAAAARAAGALERSAEGQEALLRRLLAEQEERIASRLAAAVAQAQAQAQVQAQAQAQAQAQVRANAGLRGLPASPRAAGGRLGCGSPEGLPSSPRRPPAAAPAPAAAAAAAPAAADLRRLERQASANAASLALAAALREQRAPPGPHGGAAARGVGAGAADARGAEMRQVELRVERLEQAVGEQGLAARARAKELERRVDGVAGSLRELLAAARCSSLPASPPSAAAAGAAAAAAGAPLARPPEAVRWPAPALST